MLLQEIVNSTKPFPEFIRRSNFINAKGRSLEKIFPKIGLTNNKEKANITKLPRRKFQLEKILLLAINRFKTEFNDGYDITDFKISEQFRISHTLYVMNSISSVLKDKTRFRYLMNGEPALTVPICSYDKTVLYKAGTNLFKLTQKLLTNCRHYCNVQLANVSQIEKALNSSSIVFSGDGMENVWDIATMSMRGIKSCMRWGHEQATHLVGSIVDPYCGIIYLTDGTGVEYGDKMLYRALVRLVINNADNSVGLMLDRLYSSYYKFQPEESNPIDNHVRKLFMDYLTSHTKVPVYDSVGDLKILTEKFSLPAFSHREELVDYEVSYLDTKIKQSLNVPNNELIEKYFVAHLLPKSITATKKVKSNSKKKSINYEMPC